MLHLALKAFCSEKLPFLFIDTIFKFHEMIVLRDKLAGQYGTESIVNGLWKHLEYVMSNRKETEGKQCSDFIIPTLKMMVILP